MKSTYRGQLSAFAPNVWLDEDNDMVVSWKYVERGVLVNYNRADVQQLANRLKSGETPLDTNLSSLVKADDQDLMWFHAVTTHAYLLIGNTIDRFKECYREEMDRLERVKSSSLSHRISNRALYSSSNYLIQDNDKEIAVIHSDDTLSVGLQQRLQWLDRLVAHILYQESTLPPSERQYLFILPKGTIPN